MQETLQTLKKAIEAHAQATVERLRAKEALEGALAQALVNGDIQGKNAEEREAKARVLLKELYEALAQAEVNLIRTKAALEIAKAEMETLRIQALGYGGPDVGADS